MVAFTFVAESRPALAFRVGVTGSRKIELEKTAALLQQVRAVLKQVCHEIEVLARDARAKQIYKNDPSGLLSIVLRLVSPLADGADRLVAEEALKLGYRLIAPFPFSRKEYEKDFPDNVDAFCQLAEQAEIVEIDGARGKDEAASYEAAGRFTVRNCDLLIALWDGDKVGEGRGGTAEIVQFAARSNMPIWWIDTDSGSSNLIADLTQWRRLDKVLNGDEAVTAMRAYLAKTILPPAAPAPDRPGVIGYVGRLLCNVFGYNPPPLDQYIAEKPSASSRGIWRAYEMLLDTLARPPSERSACMEPAATPLEHWWESRYRRADALSNTYANYYRSSYVLIIGLAFVTVLDSVLVGRFIGDSVSTGVDMVLLFGITALVLANRGLQWQERWITYRLLAELCRKQLILSPLGRTLPGLEINRAAEEAAADHPVATLPREAWVGWYFLAVLRSAPAPMGNVASAKRRAFALGRSLVAEQFEYHRDRREQTRTADRRLAEFGEVCFLLTFIGLIVRFALFANGEPPQWTKWIETSAVLLAASSTALVGLRAYAEFALLARQSLRMQEVMAEFAAEFDTLDLTLPLASQELGSTLHRLAMSLMLEVRGWAQLFRLKAVETG